MEYTDILQIYTITFMQTIGDSSVAQNVLSLEGNGDFISINIAWGLAVSLGAWVAGGVSGKYNVYTCKTASQSCTHRVFVKLIF